MLGIEKSDHHLSLEHVTHSKTKTTNNIHMRTTSMG